MNEPKIMGVTLVLLYSKLPTFLISFVIIYTKIIIMVASVTNQNDMKIDSTLSIISNNLMFFKNMKKGKLNCLVRVYPNTPTVDNITNTLKKVIFETIYFVFFLKSCMFDTSSPKKNMKVMYDIIPSNGQIDLNESNASYVVTGYMFDMSIYISEIKNSIAIIMLNSIPNTSTARAKYSSLFLTIIKVINNIVEEKKYNGENIRIDEANLSAKYLIYTDIKIKIQNICNIKIILPINLPNIFIYTSCSDFSPLLFINVFNTNNNIRKGINTKNGVSIEPSFEILITFLGITLISGEDIAIKNNIINCFMLILLCESSI